MMAATMIGKRCQSSSNNNLIMLENKVEPEYKHLSSKRRRQCKYAEMENVIIEVNFVKSMFSVNVFYDKNDYLIFTKLSNNQM